MHTKRTILLFSLLLTLGLSGCGGGTSSSASSSLTPSSSTREDVSSSSISSSSSSKESSSKSSESSSASESSAPISSESSLSSSNSSLLPSSSESSGSSSSSSESSSSSSSSSSSLMPVFDKVGLFYFDKSADEQFVKMEENPKKAGEYCLLNYQIGYCSPFSIRTYLTDETYTDLNLDNLKEGSAPVDETQYGRQMIVRDDCYYNIYWDSAEAVKSIFIEQIDPGYTYYIGRDEDHLNKLTPNDDPSTGSIHQYSVSMNLDEYTTYYFYRVKNYSYLDPELVESGIKLDPYYYNNAEKDGDGFNPIVDYYVEEEEDSVYLKEYDDHFEVYMMGYNPTYFVYGESFNKYNFTKSEVTPEGVDEQFELSIDLVKNKKIDIRVYLDGYHSDNKLSDRCKGTYKADEATNNNVNSEFVVIHNYKVEEGESTLYLKRIGNDFSLWALGNENYETKVYCVVDSETTYQMTLADEPEKDYIHRYILSIPLEESSSLTFTCEDVTETHAFKSPTNNLTENSGSFNVFATYTPKEDEPDVFYIIKNDGTAEVSAIGFHDVYYAGRLSSAQYASEMHLANEGKPLDTITQFGVSLSLLKGDHLHFFKKDRSHYLPQEIDYSVDPEMHNNLRADPNLPGAYAINNNFTPEEDEDSIYLKVKDSGIEIYVMGCKIDLTLQTYYGTTKIHAFEKNTAAQSDNEWMILNLQTDSGDWWKVDWYKQFGYTNIKHDCRTLVDDKGDNRFAVKRRGVYNIYLDLNNIEGDVVLNIWIELVYYN